MNVETILSQKDVKAKDKVILLSQLLKSKALSLDNLIQVAETAKDTDKANCIEAIEAATKTNPELATNKLFEFVCLAMQEKAPRIKWESARVIGNTAHYFPSKVKNAISILLLNARHPGTVVRWSAAYALSEIVKLKTIENTSLLPEIKFLLEKEEKNSIKKIYFQALKQIHT